jgi:hypothetical protein
MVDEDRGSVEDDEVLLRRCPQLPPHFHAPVDLVTQSVKMPTAALSLKDKENGLSVYREGLLAEKKISPEAVRKPNQALFRFPAAAAAAVGEASWKVLPDPRDEEPIIGFAHALIAPYEKFVYIRKQHRADLDVVRFRIIDVAQPVVLPAA